MAIEDVTLTGPYADEVGVAPIITALALGLPILPGAADRFFPRIQVPSPLFQWWRYDNAHLVHQDTKRAFSAPYKFDDPKASLQTSSLLRHSFAGRADVDQIAASRSSGADPKYASRRANIARQKIALDREVEAAAILTASGSYAAGHVTAITSGQEWDSPAGDSNATIGVAADAILAKTGTSREMLSVGLSESSYRAATNDPTFKAIRQYTGSAYPTTEVLRAYWGVGEVFTFNPIKAEDVTAGTAPTPIYDDVAIVFVPNSPAEYDLTNGSLVFGANFAWNGGVASRPFYVDKESTWYYPWNDWYKMEIISNTAGYLITNTKA